MAIIRQEEVKISKFNELQGYYLQDTWKLCEHPKFIIHPEDKRYQNQRLGGGLNIYFERCNNLGLREELKYWVYHLIEIVNREIISLSTDISTLHRFIKFANEYKEEMNLLLDMTIEEIEIWYKEILLLKGYQAEYNGRFIVNKNMVKNQHKYENSGLAELRKMYVAIDEYLRPNLNPIPEYEKDSWDIRNLPFKVELPPARPRYTISFLKIHQDILKKYAKKYIFIRLKSKSYNTCVDDLKGINEFSDFLNENYKDITHLQELNRDILEDYISYIKTLPKLGITSKRSRLGVLKTFLEVCRFNNWDNITPNVLMYDKDLKFKVKTLPDYYTDEEIQSFNKYITDLPKQIAWMLFVIQSVGMRVSELCSLRKENLIQNPNGTYSLKYKQPKAKNYNTVPIVEEVAGVINEAILYSEKSYGKDVKYVFARDNKKYITTDSFSRYVNILSYSKGLIGSNGKPLRMKSHGFRGTVATKYANIGLSPEVIRMMLGQKSLGSLKHYVEIHNGTVLEAMKEIIDIQNSMIEGIGKERKVILIDNQTCSTPLPNGQCKKPSDTEACNHANACYTCRMFIANKEYLSVYKHQQLEVERNIKIAQMNNWERIEKINTELFESLTRIIDSLGEVDIFEEENRANC